MLNAIKREVSIPLVLHGGSGTGDDNLARAVREGIQKVNLNTDISKAGQAALRDALNGTKEFALDKNATGEFAVKKLNLQQTIALGVEGYKAELKRYMKLFGSENRW